MADESEFAKARIRIDEVVRENISAITNNLERPDSIGEDFVLGWFLVVESMASATFEGKETQAYALHTISCETTASRDLTPWAAKGYLQQVLGDSVNYLSDFNHFEEEDDD